MAKIQKHIEIVRSSIVWLSSLSLESCDTLFATLLQHYETVGITTVNTPQDLQQLLFIKPDLVFLGMKFVPSVAEGANHDCDKIWVSKFLDDHNIAYTGSDCTAHKLELNKPLAKKCVASHGLATAPFHVAVQTHFNDIPAMNLRFPVFIKPTNRGGGLGVDSASVAHTNQQVHAKVTSIAAEHQSDSLIEAYLPGREFSVAVLKDEASQAYIAMPIELIAQPDDHGVRVLSAEVKSANAETALEVSEKMLNGAVQRFALEVFHAIGARDYGRIDIRLDSNGNPQFLEANLIPSLISGYGSFPKACQINRQIDYSSMILSIVRLGLVRSQNSPTPEDIKGAVDLAAMRALVELA